MAYDNGVHFPVVGKLFQETRGTQFGRVGNAEAISFRIRDLVDFAQSYFQRELASS
jgi:aminoglycoside N3'-acetyltransferase